jgi:hypothetical protein
MTAYAALGAFSSGAAGYLIGVKPVTYPVRIAKLDLTSLGIVTPSIYHYKTSSLSSGATVTPLPLRGGAPASTVICKSALTPANISGTPTLIALLSAGGVHSIGVDAGGAQELVADWGSGSYTFPFDYIVAVGDAFVCAVSTSAGSGSSSPATAGYLTIYFEELRLSWSF